MVRIVSEGDLIGDIIDGKADVALYSLGINNALNRGLVRELSVNFPQLSSDVNSTGYCDKRKYGTCVFTKYGCVTISGLFIHNGGYRRDSDGVFVNYDALKMALKTLDGMYTGKRVHSYLLGTDKFDGNGDRDMVYGIFSETCKRNDYQIYDMPQVDYSLECFRKIAELRKRYIDRDITSDEYLEKRSCVEWERRNGRVSEKPEDYVYIPKKDKKITKIKISDLRHGDN